MASIELFRVLRGMNAQPEPEIHINVHYGNFNNIAFYIDQPGNGGYAVFRLYSDQSLQIGDTVLPNRVFVVDKIDEERLILSLVAAQEGQMSWEIAEQLGAKLELVNER